ncbi:unnamed protein product [Paramecium octaurelia]|uniref:Uncharacterized protein n=1 Tax=Paramecium octaurelia TaxID=43137 RepID=A0A8S1WER0_PAROT|nr:unnamed protein product [Paramecium octaurelia]
MAVILFGFILLQSTDKFIYVSQFSFASKRLQFHQKFVEMVYFLGFQYKQNIFVKLLQGITAIIIFIRYVYGNFRNKF